MRLEVIYFESSQGVSPVLGAIAIAVLGSPDDLEGRMKMIERDDGPSVQTAYEYTYTGDGIRHMKKDYLATKEYRYGCSIDCGGTPLRVYSRELGSEDPWVSIDDRMFASGSLWYGANQRVSYPAGNLVLTGSSATSIDMDYKDSAGLPVMGSLPLCDEESLVPMPCVPADCWMTEEGVMLGGSGTGSLPQFGFTTAYYMPNVVWLPIFLAALRGCATSIGMSMLIEIGQWLVCAALNYMSGKPVSGCGAFPKPEACDMIADCIAGALTGGLLEKLWPKLREGLRDLVAALLGNVVGGGICRSLASPYAPCPPSSPNPKPVRQKDGFGSIGRIEIPYPTY